MKNTRLDKDSPIFLMFLDVSELDGVNAKNYRESMMKYLINHSIGDCFHIMIIPWKIQTKIQVFYPNGTDGENYDDLIKELAKLTAKKNVRIKI